MPFGVAHAGAWKAPVYRAWVGLWYELLGASAARVAVVQGLVLAPLGVLLTWMLGRRLLGPAVGLGAAAIVAVFPLVWEYYGLLYPEALAVPAALLLYLLFLERPPTAEAGRRGQDGRRGRGADPPELGLRVRRRPRRLGAGRRLAPRRSGLTALAVAVAALTVARGRSATTWSATAS